MGVTAFLFLIRFRHHVPSPYLYDQTMVYNRVHSLYFMASSHAHDSFCQKTNTLSTWFNVKKTYGRDVTRASHTSRLYPGLYAVIKTMSRMWIQPLVCVFFIPWGHVNNPTKYGHLWRHISHMGSMRESDWSRENLLRSDWLLTKGATITTGTHHHETTVKKNYNACILNDLKPK